MLNVTSEKTNLQFTSGGVDLSVRSQNDCAVLRIAGLAPAGAAPPCVPNPVAVKVRLIPQASMLPAELFRQKP